MSGLATWDEQGARATGFEGFVPFADLPLAKVPPRPGVYLVLREAMAPTFLTQSTGGRFKGKDPSLDESRLRAEWLDGTQVVYIGKASARKSKADGLRRRLDEYRRFGQGKPVGHWGGRLVWQLVDSDALVVAWKESESPSELESELLAAFVRDHGRLPFANLRR